ncbi:MAG: cobalamin-dependent protein [Planctomycetes bacterium]|nr:cobalamin-dependent protein [Planctomycetota bacterium]
MSSPQRFAAHLLRTASRAYAAAAVDCLRRERPQLLADGLPAEFADPLDDTQVRILHLAESVAVDRPALLEHSIAWYKVALHHRGVPADYLRANLDAIETALRQELPADAAAIARRHLLAARAHVERAPASLPSLLSRQAPHGDLAARFLLAVLEARGDDALDLLRGALDAGTTIADLHDHVLTVAQREAGRMWLMGEITIADEHYGSALADRALWLLHERLPRPPAGAPRVLTLGVGGNLHDLGLRLVAQRLQLAGFAVHHLGGNMPPGELDLLLADQRVDLIAVSATMALHLHALAQTIDHLRQAEAGGRRRPILVGGEPFRVVPDLHALLGADAAATDADGAVAAARRLVATPA